MSVAFDQRMSMTDIAPLAPLLMLAAVATVLATGLTERLRVPAPALFLAEAASPSRQHDTIHPSDERS
jgi:hypothetical protein